MYDEKAHGEYRTKRVILDIYDAMAEASRTGRPYQTASIPTADPASRWNVRELARQIEASAVERSVLGPPNSQRVERNPPWSGRRNRGARRIRGRGAHQVGHNPVTQERDCAARSPPARRWRGAVIQLA